MDPIKFGKLSDSNVTIEQLKSTVNRFVSERNWEKFHSPKNLSMSIAIEAGELMELFQWTNPSSPAIAMGYETAVAQEIADVLAYTLRLAYVLGIDLSKALEFKMEQNRAKYPLGLDFQPRDIFDKDSQA